MPIQIIVAEGALTPAAEAEAFCKLTELLLRRRGLTGNRFMTPNVIGEVTIAPKGRNVFRRQADRDCRVRAESAVLRCRHRN